MVRAYVLFCLCWRCLTGVFGESLSVTEGDSVTLHTDASQIHQDEDILWKFGAQKSVIAQIKREEEIFPDVRFREGVKLDHQTGSLTITSVSTKHTGLYEVKISGEKRSTKVFSVSVYARLPTPNITRDSSPNSLSSSPSSSCSLLCLAVNVGHVTLSWYKGNSLLSSISVSDLSISLSLPLEVEYQDKNTYSCVINNPIRNQTRHLNVTQICQIHSDRSLPLFYVLLIPAAAGSLLIAATVVTCCFCKTCGKTIDTQEEGRMDAALCKPTRKTKSKTDTVYENVPKRR